MALTLQRFMAEDMNGVCTYLESIREFDEITQIIPKNRPISEEHLTNLLATGQGIGAVVYDTENDKVVGIGLALLMEMWWGTDKVWNNTVLFVEPAYRGTRAYDMLMDFYKKISDSTGIVFNLEVISGENTNFKVYDRVFGFKGFKRVGSLFIYDPRDSVKIAA